MEVISQVEDGSVTLLVDFEVAIVSTQVHVVQSESQLHGISRPWQIYLTRFEYLSVSHVGNELNFLQPFYGSILIDNSLQSSEFLLAFKSERLLVVLLRKLRQILAGCVIDNFLLVFLVIY